MNTKETSTRLFGVTTQHQSSQVILQNVPWNATSFRNENVDSKALLEASQYLELYDLENGEAWKHGYHLEVADTAIAKLNEELKPLAKTLSPGNIDKVNSASRQLNEKVYERTVDILKAHKIPGLIGGDHSSAYGAIHAVSDFYNGDFGVLHIGASADLRNAHQGFTHSHASVMRNVLELETAPKKVVQVGICDFNKDEHDYIQENETRIKTFFETKLKNSLAEGDNWRSVCERIISELPGRVYVSFNLGSLSFDQAVYLLRTLGLSGKKIVGFDLNDIAASNDVWNTKVAARILLKLCGWAVTTQNKKQDSNA